MRMSSKLSTLYLVFHAQAQTDYILWKFVGHLYVKSRYRNQSTSVCHRFVHYILESWLNCSTITSVWEWNVVVFICIPSSMNTSFICHDKKLVPWCVSTLLGMPSLEISWTCHLLSDEISLFWVRQFSCKGHTISMAILKNGSPVIDKLITGTLIFFLGLLTGTWARSLMSRYWHDQ